MAIANEYFDEDGHWTLAMAYRAIERDGHAVDIGQIGPVARKAFDKLVRQGALVKYRGYWTTLHAAFGMGPLKTIWAIPEIAERAADIVASLGNIALREGERAAA